MSKIFISYRRKDSGHQADRLYGILKRYLPRDNIFMDVDSIPPGVDFAEYLGARVEQCDVLLALIGSDWLSITDSKTGKRRLDDPKDFVRIEIAEALRRDIPVVPVMLDGTPMPRPDDLPVQLRDLVSKNAADVRRLSFEADLKRLFNGLGLSEIETPTTSVRLVGNPVAMAISGAGLIALLASVLWATTGFNGNEKGKESTTPNGNVSFRLPCSQLFRVEEKQIIYVQTKNNLEMGRVLEFPLLIQSVEGDGECRTVTAIWDFWKLEGEACNQFRFTAVKEGEGVMTGQGHCTIDEFQGTMGYTGNHGIENGYNVTFVEK